MCQKLLRETRSRRRERIHQLAPEANESQRQQWQEWYARQMQAQQMQQLHQMQQMQQMQPYAADVERAAGPTVGSDAASGKPKSTGRVGGRRLSGLSAEGDGRGISVCCHWKQVTSRVCVHSLAAGLHWSPGGLERLRVVDFGGRQSQP